MKKTILLALFVSAFFTSKAQTDKLVERGLFRLNIVAPGASYELGLGKRSTLNFEAILVPLSERVYGSTDNFEIFPALGAEYRYYTNMRRRIGKGKNIRGNSGNYVSFLNQAIIAAPILGNIEHDTPVSYIGALNYGIQRTRPKGFYWNVSFGPGVGITESDFGPAVLIDTKLGWVVKKIR
ncbi:hypothetical protein [Cytophaga sp. FL35]|uniref:hypothetical protein n=1 Tax=Cytophaga sp. FL35 TaxID=1904456 RepID=UPI00165345D6|nr:hypothetical protein [Cytophaga sp. FL35]MBC6998160.1 hypothetical protein [Cytophaga sp. FL35]